MPWITSQNLFPIPITVDDISYANGTYLVHAEKHPNGTGCFCTSIISNNLNNWQHVQNSPPTFNNLNKRDVSLYSTGDRFIAGMVIDDKVAVYSSMTGFNWDKLGSFTGANFLNVQYDNGIIFVLGVGYINLSTDEGKSWLSLPVTEKYSTSSVIGMTYYNQRHYFLLKNIDNSYSILYSSDGMTSTVYDLATTLTVSKIVSTGQQIILVTSTTLMYSSDGMTYSSWKTMKIELPKKDDPTKFATLYDAIYYNNELLIVGSYEFTDPSKQFTFSYGSFSATIPGMINYQTVVNFVDLPLEHVTTLKEINGKIIAMGRSFPKPSNCMYEWRDE
jgi:hypothetical protein